MSNHTGFVMFLSRKILSAVDGNVMSVARSEITSLAEFICNSV